MIVDPVRIHPLEIAFDIDGVVADTMEVFIRLAHEHFGLMHLSKEHISSYDLHVCLGLEKEILDRLICLTLDDFHTLQIPPVPGAPELLDEIAASAPLIFVTARIWPESITKWLHGILPNVPHERMTVIASGDPRKKPAILKELGIRYFLEDRAETCRELKNAGIQPLLLTQPWNRNERDDGFIRLDNWMSLREWLLPPDTILR